MSDTEDHSDPTDLDALVGRVDPDRWLSSRFIDDVQARADVIAVYAFDHELARAPRVASNPLMGEIRLTWWREVLDEVFEDRPVRHHPTAQALGAAVRRRGLPRDGLETMIDSRYRELDAAPMNLADALAWARGTGGAAARLAAAILDPAAGGDTVEAGGTAWSIGRLMITAGLTGAEASEALEAARSAARGVSAAAFPAIAHGALARVHARGHRPGPLETRARLFWAVATGRI